MFPCDAIMRSHPNIVQALVHSILAFYRKYNTHHSLNTRMPFWAIGSHLMLAQVSIMGHSLGGQLAFDILCHQPIRLGGEESARQAPPAPSYAIFVSA
jgi:pimeloyl-ACP methyl ester carboxylesterase